MEFLLENIFGVFWAALILLMSFWAVCSIVSSRYNEPASALLWLLLVVFAPGIGVGLYLVFGVRMSAHRDTRINCPEPPPDSNESMRTQLPPLIATLSKLFPEESSENNAMKLLEDGTKAYPEMLFAIENATKSIELQSFIIMADPVGTLFLQKLEERALAGVKVHLVYDSFGSFKAVYRRFFRRKVENLKIRAYSPLSIFTPWRLQYRNHRKLLIVDNAIAFMG
ncbi:MAG: PLDc N-terminal domain-containing protein, partial [Victivallaceae bacterium]